MDKRLIDDLIALVMISYVGVFVITLIIFLLDYLAGSVHVIPYTKYYIFGAFIFATLVSIFLLFKPFFSYKMRISAKKYGWDLVTKENSEGESILNYEIRSKFSNSIMVDTYRKFDKDKAWYVFRVSINSGKYSTPKIGYACINRRSNFPNFMLRKKRLDYKIFNGDYLQEVKMENKEFFNKYLLQSSSSQDVKNFFDSKLITYLLNLPKGIELQGGRQKIALFTYIRFNTDRLFKDFEKFKPILEQFNKRTETLISNF